MKFPIQARPVARQTSQSRLGQTGVTASGGFECSLCHLACDAISNPLAKQACQ
jgi:hypothetical protein